jgi:methylglyoxal synthase
MMQDTIAMRRNKKIALAAQDTKKAELFEWAKCYCKLLAEHSLYATGATGQLLKSGLGLNVTQLESRPLEGDQQIGSRISEGRIDCVIFFSDPLEPQPHDADVKALLRIAVVWNILIACNRASADFIISSPLMSTVYERKIPDYSKYRARLGVREVEGDESAWGNTTRKSTEEQQLLCMSNIPHYKTQAMPAWSKADTTSRIKSQSSLAAAVESDARSLSLSPMRERQSPWQLARPIKFRRQPA